jgi:hypothetical protein
MAVHSVMVFAELNLIFAMSVSPSKGNSFLGLGYLRRAELQIYALICSIAMTTYCIYRRFNWVDNEIDMDR